MWCLIESEDLKIPLSVRGRAPKRDLENIHDDLQDFREKGGGQLKNAKLHNNVIDDVIFNIPLTNVKSTHHKNRVSVVFAFTGVHTWAPHLFGDF